VEEDSGLCRSSKYNYSPSGGRGGRGETCPSSMCPHLLTWYSVDSKAYCLIISPPSSTATAGI
jgi:hypothetical protein